MVAAVVGIQCAIDLKREGGMEGGGAGGRSFLIAMDIHISHIRPFTLPAFIHTFMSTMLHLYTQVC